jgi:hypothetical protein
MIVNYIKVFLWVYLVYLVHFCKIRATNVCRLGQQSELGLEHLKLKRCLTATVTKPDSIQVCFKSKSIFMKLQVSSSYFQLIAETHYNSFYITISNK